MLGVTVIVPVYNVEDYMKRAIDSYVHQSFKSMEVILVDDGSTDGSGKICDIYALEYEQVTAFHTKNNGVSKARNYAIRKAKYDYLFFADADDYIEENALEKMYERMRKDESDLVISGYYMETINSSSSMRCKKYKPLEDMILNTFEEFNSIELWDNSLMYNVWNRLYNKNIIRENKIYFNQLRLGEDLDFNMRYMECCHKISVMNSCFYHYIRGRAGSVTSSYIKNWFEIRNEEHNRLLTYFKNHHIYDGEMIEFLNRRYIERVLGCIENEFHNKDHSSRHSRMEFIKYVIHNEKVVKALKLLKPKSRKVAIMIIPLKTKSAILTYLMGGTIATIRRLFPQLYAGLKTAR